AIHLQIGQSISSLKQENILILGSGFSFHNLRALRAGSTEKPDDDNEAFEGWLSDTCTNISLSSEERMERLLQWAEAPSARYCHPREEHLLPLHVCYGASETVGKQVFDDIVIGKRTSGFLW
ncbi:MAG: DODA-type extradiol aromatic ring-opening family dioxygenase, partial [Thiolinea sp.]